MEVQTQALTLWAKSGDPFHSLLAHMLDTAAVAWAILEREPGRTRKLYATDWNLGEKEALPWVAFLAGLHDLGKASPVFQAAWDEGAKRVWDAGLTWDEELVREQWVAHGVFTELYVKDALKRHGLPLRLADPLAKGLGAHHGFLAQGEELKTARLHVKSEASTWQEVRDHLALRLAQSLGLNLPLVLPVEDAEAPAILRVMALASFADWIASDPRFFSYGRDPEALEYWQDALELARKALEDLPWPRVSPRGVRRFEELFPFSPNPLQSSVPELLEKTPGDSVLLLVEAPMGLGKTEAALYASHLLRERLDHRGLYVALPTQATANGLFNRIREFLERLSGGERWELQLQHGAALLNPQYAELLERARPMEVYDLELERNPGQESGGVAASTWFSAKKRAMLAGHGVGTLDQALLGVLKVKHHFIRLWGLMNRVVVLDEVHAYDTYTSGLLKSLLLWLRALGSSVILMTATLPKKKREELLSAWGVGGVELPPYPRVAAFSGGGLLGARHVPLEEKTLHLQGAPTEVSQVAEALKEQLPGALGAIVNTVDRAQALYQALGEGERLTLDELLDSLGAGPNQGAWPGLWEIREEKGRWVVGKRLKDGTLVFLLHARFPAEERALREAVTLALFGKHGPRPEKAILVATQVAEQSLDLDFDLLYSDLAPVDLLFQRAGRLHRHTRKRPEGHQTPVLLVGGLTDEPEFGRELHWNRVYEDYVLLSTWLALQGRETVKVPADLEGLLEEVYERLPEGFPDSLRDRARKSYQNLIDRLQKDASMAGNLSLAELDRLLSQLDASALASDFRLDDEEENASTQRFLTRLGEPSVSVVPLYRRGEEWFLDADGRRPAKMKGDLGKEDVLALWSRAVRLSRFPIPQTLLGEKPPSAWAKSGLLRGLRPLEVERVFAREDSVLKVVVDEELGVVYVDV